MRLVAALEGRLEQYMAEEARGIERAVDRSIRQTTEETKLRARAHVAGKLGRRAGFLVTSKIYKDAPADMAGLVYSRWRRAAAAATDRRASDVLAAHAYGATIRPQRGRFVYVPNVRGRLRRRERRVFQAQAGAVDLLPFTDKRGNLAYAVVERRRRGRGRLIAMLFQEVRLRPTLALEPIYRQAEAQLTRRLIGYLERPDG